MWVSQLFVTLTKLPDKNTAGRKVYLGSWFQRFGPCLAYSIVALGDVGASWQKDVEEESCSTQDSQEAEREQEEPSSKYNLQGYAPSDVLPAAPPHVPTVIIQ